MWGWLVFGGLLVLMQGRLFAHYAIPFVIPLAVLARHPGVVRRRFLLGATGACLMLSLVAMQAYPQRGPATVEVAEWIREHTAPSESVLVWGMDANTYLAAGRGPAGRYPYLMPLVTPGYTTDNMIAAWVESLENEPPSVVVDAEAANEHWSETDDFLKPPPPGSAGGRNLDLLEPFRTYVRSHYLLATELSGRKIYVLRKPSSTLDQSG
jgi:hypothetical protein